MKVLIAISCYLAVASAGYFGTAYTGVVAPHHVPVIGANGVPVEPAANVAARAAHAAAHADARARNGDYYATPYAYTGAVVGPVYAGAQHIPVIGANGVPVEPAANVAARAAHAAAHVEAKARNGDVAVAVAAPVAYSAAAPFVAGVTPYAYGAYGHYAYGQHVPVIGPNGVPLEPAANVAARASHAASHIEAKVRNGDLAVLGRKRRGVFHGGVAAPFAYSAAYGTPVYAGAQHIPVIGANGVPLEPAANVAARASHAAAHAEAVARNGDYAVVAPAVGSVAVGVHPAATYPALAADGQPLETPEVVAAKSAHFVAHAEATARNYAGAVYSPVAYAAPYTYATPYTTGVVTHAGVPLDTPEVAAAKAAHYQAHINDKIAHGIL